MYYEKIRSSPSCIVANFQQKSSVRFGSRVMLIPIRSDPIVRKRMAILWHKHHGWLHYQIAELCDAAPNTVTATIRTY